MSNAKRRYRRRRRARLAIVRFEERWQRERSARYRAIERDADLAKKQWGARWYLLRP